MLTSLNHFYVYDKTGVYRGIYYFSEAVLTSTHNLCFEQKYEKYQNFYLKIFIFFGGKIFIIFE